MFARVLLQPVVAAAAGQPAHAVGQRALAAAATAGANAGLGHSSSVFSPSPSTGFTSSSVFPPSPSSDGSSSASGAGVSWRAAHQQQQRAGMFVVVNVRNNNVDAAYGRLNRHCQENGLYTELRKRDHREPNHELAFQAKRATFNKRMGQQVRDRLKWVMKRRHM